MKITSQLKKRAAAVFEKLRKAYPDARCELDFSNPLELAVAAILSAQCTDKRVNMVTPGLFKKYRTAADWAAASQDVLEQEIRSTGFFRNKAKNIRALGDALVAKYDGRLPGDLDPLVALPGIGRKTANLLMADAFHKPGIIVDTHCRRVSQRIELTEYDDPDKIEFDLKALIPEEHWSLFSHCMVFHGRYCCHARKPACPECPVNTLCPARRQFQPEAER
ncbi:MAG: endonuclease III [Kiritimatiellae bacterium]|nr:endonuclease III [Kiritimatiellia bacterium]